MSPDPFPLEGGVWERDYIRLHGSGHTNGALFYHVLSQLQWLQCPPYEENRVLFCLNNYCNHVAHASHVNHSYDIKSSFTTIESRKYAAPFLLHASIGQTGKGAHSQDHDIFEWQLLPTNECHMGARACSLCCTFSGCLMEKSKQSELQYDTNSQCTGCSCCFIGVWTLIATFYSQSRGGGGGGL